MAKIKITELKNAVKLNEKEEIKVIPFNGLEIEIKTYIPFQEKINLVGTIFESAINRDNGFHILNGNSLNLAFRVLLVEKYTNLTLPKNIVETYDMLTSSGLFDLIYEAIPTKELSEIRMALDNYIDAERDEYEQKNTIKYIIKDFISSLPSKEETEALIKSAKEEFSNFDPNKLEFVKEFLAKTSGEKGEN